MPLPCGSFIKLSGVTGVSLAAEAYFVHPAENQQSIRLALITTYLKVAKHRGQIWLVFNPLHLQQSQICPGLLVALCRSVDEPQCGGDQVPFDAAAGQIQNSEITLAPWVACRRSLAVPIRRTTEVLIDTSPKFVVQPKAILRVREPGTRRFLVPQGSFSVIVR